MCGLKHGLFQYRQTEEPQNSWTTAATVSGVDPPDLLGWGAAPKGQTARIFFMMVL